VFTYASFLRLHGIEHVVRAAERLKSHQDILFTIAGDGPYRSRMEGLARDLGLQNVCFPGWMPFDQLPARIADADLCLGGHFSKVPKAGRVIATKTFQFLAMGKPTVVGDTLANGEVMTHRREAYFCPVADPHALATAILELRDDPALRRQLGENGLALYRQRFTVGAVARALQDVLGGLVV
jgi:glycosyltransferase involved in cell wall biosynthesis